MYNKLFILKTKKEHLGVCKMSNENFIRII